jgi:hypothetical protein
LASRPDTEAGDVYVDKGNPDAAKAAQAVAIAEQADGIPENACAACRCG